MTIAAEEVTRAPVSAAGSPAGADLFEKAPWLARMARARSFQFLLVFPNFAVFYLLMLAGIFGHPLGNVNSAVVLIWILWWFLLIAVLVPFGARAWCAMCPLPAPGEWIQRRSVARFRGFEKPRGANRPWPRRFRNIWLQNAGFLGLAVISALLVTRPMVTVAAVGGIWVLATVLMMRYRGRSFCVYLCPVSGFQGLYAMVSPIALRAKSTEVCAPHRPKGCFTGTRPRDGSDLGYPCPWFQNVATMERNNYCGLCMECMKSCGKDNIGLFWRGARMDVQIHGRDEAWKAFIMAGLAAIYAIVLLGPYGWLKDWANAPFSGSWGGFGTLAGAMVAGTTLVLPATFALFVEASRRLARAGVGFWTLFMRAAFGLVPLGLAAWIAFSVPLVLVNWAYVARALSDPFGWGWNLFGTKQIAWHPVAAGAIPAIQAALVLAGLLVAVVKTHRALELVLDDPRRATRATVPIAAFLALVSIGFLVLFTG